MTVTARVALGLVILLAACAADPEPEAQSSMSRLRDLSCLELAQGHNDTAAEVRWYAPAVVDAYEARDVAATQTAYDALLDAGKLQLKYRRVGEDQCDDWPEEADWARLAVLRDDLRSECRRSWEPLGIDC